MSNDEIIDFSFLESFLDTREDMQETAEVFSRTVEKGLEALESAMQSANHGDWIEAAHQVKGSASMIGATALSKLCDEAQNMQPADKGVYAQSYELISTSYEEAKADLAKKITTFGT